MFVVLDEGERKWCVFLFPWESLWYQSCHHFKREFQVQKKPRYRKKEICKCVPHTHSPPPPACRLRFYQSSHSFLTHTHAWTCRQKLENPVPLLESEWFGTPSRPRSVKPTAGRNWSQVSEAWVRKWGATREPWLSGSTGLCWLFGDQQLICLWKTFPSASNSNDLKWITAASPAFWGSWGWERD